jgi:hypothetical protein
MSVKNKKGAGFRAQFLDSEQKSEFRPRLLFSVTFETGSRSSTDLEMIV